MGYQIKYDIGTRKYEVKKESNPNVLWLTLGAFAAFFILCAYVWPEGNAFLRDLLIPGEDVQTLAALKTLAQDLRQGIRLPEAAATFCQEVFHGAEGLH